MRKFITWYFNTQRDFYLRHPWMLAVVMVFGFTAPIIVRSRWFEDKVSGVSAAKRSREINDRFDALFGGTSDGSTESILGFRLGSKN